MEGRIEMPELKYSLEIIRRYREIDQTDGFHREIMERQPGIPQRGRLRRVAPNAPRNREDCEP
jgi:hypothetical protein